MEITAGEAIKQGFVLRAIYDGGTRAGLKRDILEAVDKCPGRVFGLEGIAYQEGERAGQVCDVLVLALMVQASSARDRSRGAPQSWFWLVYDPATYRRTQEFSTIQVNLIRFQAVIAASRVPVPWAMADVHPTETAGQWRTLWEQKAREIPRGFLPVWKPGWNISLPFNIPGIHKSVPVILER